MVRQWFAKPSFVGSIPTSASIIFSPNSLQIKRLGLFSWFDGEIAKCARLRAKRATKGQLVNPLWHKGFDFSRFGRGLRTRSGRINADGRHESKRVRRARKWQPEGNRWQPGFAAEHTVAGRGVSRAGDVSDADVIGRRLSTGGGAEFDDGQAALAQVGKKIQVCGSRIGWTAADGVTARLPRNADRRRGVTRGRLMRSS